MNSLCVMDLDLSISPDVFGLRAFDTDSPNTRILPDSTPYELRLMLPDAKLGIDGFHDIIIDNLTASPPWRSSYISQGDVAALRRRWTKDVHVFRTLYRRSPDVERLRRDARKRSDRAFRYSGPGYCSVCEERVHTALDSHMIAFHLELAQLWRCPVEWYAVWKGSVREYLEHLAEKHGGSTFVAMENVEKFFLPWTLTQSVWLHALCPDFRGSRGHSPISRGGTTIGSSLSDLPGPVSSPGTPGRYCCSPAVLRGPGHAHRQAYSSENTDSVIGGASWQGACGVFSGGEPPMYGRREAAMCHFLTKSPCWRTRICRCAPRKQTCRH